MLHRKELVLRYAGSGWPFALMSLSSAAWAHGTDIMSALDLNSILRELRDRLAREPPPPWPDPRSMDLLQQQMQGLLDGLRRRRRSFFVDLGVGEERRRVVRELYQRLLRYGIRLAAPRLKFQTPSSYRPTLAGLCPEERASVDALTAVYVIARYGTDPPTVDQVKTAQEAYRRIEEALRRTYELGAQRSL